MMFQREGHCPACAQTVRLRGALGRVATAVVFVGVIGVGMAELARTSARDKSAPQAKVAKEQNEAYAPLEAALASDPCDRDAIVALAKAKYAAEDNRGGVDRSAQFFAKCGEHEVLRSMSLAAHKRLGELNAALTEADVLVAADGANKDYRSWRASLYEQTGQLERAAAEYRIAITTSPDVIGIPTNVAGVYERLGRPCDAITPLEQLVYHHPVGTEGPRRRLIALYESPSCAPRVGLGRAVVRFAPGAGEALGAVRVNGKMRGKLVVDTAAPFVTLGPKFAKKLGLPFETWPSIDVPHGADAGARRARLGTLDAVELEGVQANGVQAVVVDSYLGPADGVLGASFLGRFVVQIDAERGRIDIASRAPTSDAGAAP